MERTTDLSFEDIRGDDLVEDETLQWFVDLFVAEYAAESTRPADAG